MFQKVNNHIILLLAIEHLEALESSITKNVDPFHILSSDCEQHLSFHKASLKRVVLRKSLQCTVRTYITEAHCLSDLNVDISIYHHHKHQGLDPLIRSVSRVIAALVNVS
jgi:hypothetical protein